MTWWNLPLFVDIAAISGIYDAHSQAIVFNGVNDSEGADAQPEITGTAFELFSVSFMRQKGYSMKNLCLPLFWLF
ncbi:MAG: hypothetical protein IJF67_06150 [Clostridia bacterium]|nr:hypothetical protein [Clostridia bacterium]